MEENNVKKSGFSTAGLVLGIVGTCTSFLPIINNLSFVMGLIAIIFAIIAMIKKSGKGKIIATIIFGILAIVLTIKSQDALSESLNEVSKSFDQVAGNSTEEILANNVDVVIGDFQVKSSGYGLKDTWLPVHIQNKSSEPKSFSIQIEAVDENGTRLKNDYIFASSLSSGQAQDFKIFEYVESEMLEQMKNATFRIVEISMY